MKHTFLKRTLRFVPICLIFLTACENEPKESKEIAKEQNEQKFTKAGEKDAEFVVDATSSSYNEVSIAEVALSKSTNAEIKKMAAELKNDHSAIINELKKVGESKSISMPVAATEDAMEEAKDLNEKKAKDFDKAWLSEVKTMHEKSVKKYEDASANATDADIKTWAGTTLVKIRSHLDMIVQMENKMK